MLSVRRILAVGVFTTLVVASIAAFSYAQTNGEEVIHACYDNNNGTMRYINPSDPDGPKACKDNETALEWNLEGIQGPQGIQGPPGPQGGVDVRWSRLQTQVDIPFDAPPAPLLELYLPSGAWVVTGTVRISNASGERVPVNCSIWGWQSSSALTTYTASAPPGGDVQTLPLLTVLPYSSGGRTVQMMCRSNLDATHLASANDRTLVAISANSVTQYPWPPAP